MIKSNEKIINNLIEHLKLGKPISNRARKPISKKTEIKYRKMLMQLDKWFGKFFEELTEDDVDSFRVKLRDDKIRTLKGKPFEESVKRDIENKGLKTLLKFLGKTELAMFTNRYNDQKEIPSLSKEEIESAIESMNLRDKVVWQILFDGGFRAEEFLNVKWKDLRDDSLKSNGYYKIRITKSKTKPRTIGLTLPKSTEIINQWLKVNKDKIGTNKPFVDISRSLLNQMIRNVGEKYLKKKCFPHLLRHSSATYYCHYLNQYQLCKRYGWAMASDMPQRYIDREGVDDEEINNKVNSEENNSLIKEINKLKEEISMQQEKINSYEENTEEILKKLLKEKLSDLIKAKGILIKSNK